MTLTITVIYISEKLLIEAVIETLWQENFILFFIKTRLYEAVAHSVASTIKAQCQY